MIAQWHLCESRIRTDECNIISDYLNNPWPDKEGRGGGYPDPGEEAEHADEGQVGGVGGHPGQAQGGRGGQQHHACTPWSDQWSGSYDVTCGQRKGM